jgi:hypothetical protein
VCSWCAMADLQRLVGCLFGVLTGECGPLGPRRQLHGLRVASGSEARHVLASPPARGGGAPCMAKQAQCIRWLDGGTRWQLEAVAATVQPLFHQQQQGTKSPTTVAAAAAVAAELNSQMQKLLLHHQQQHHAIRCQVLFQLLSCVLCRNKSNLCEVVSTV